MVKINLGCGWRNFGEEWVHIDAGAYEHLDYTDIINLPFDDNKVDLIYASHVIEYFNREDVLKLLEEAGFSNIRKWDWRTTDHSQFDDHSQAYLPKMDKENGTLISLNIEADNEF